MKAKFVFAVSILILYSLQHISAAPYGITVKASYDEQNINVIVWICPDPTLFDMIQSSLQMYQNVDDINKSVQDKVTGYRGAIWLVSTINYSRTTADTEPGPNRSTRNLCFVQAPDEKIIVFVASVVH